MSKNLNILRSVLAVLILAIPLYPKFPLRSVTGTYVAIRVDDYLVAAAVIIWIIHQFRNRFPVLKNQTIIKLFLLYFTALIVSVVNAVLINQTTPISIHLLHLFRRFEYASLFFVTLSAVQTKNDLRYPYLFLLLATIGISAYGYGQKYFHFPVISTMNEEFSKGQLLQMDVWTRINSTFAGHYDLAAYLSCVLIIIAGVGLVVKNRYLKSASLIIFLLGFHILTLTASRVSIFAFWGGIIITLLAVKKYLWIFPISTLVIFSMFNSKDLNQRLLATIPAIKIQINKRSTASLPTPTPTLIPTTTPVIAGPIPSSPPRPVFTPTPTPTIFRHKLEEFPPIDSDIGVARSGEIRFNVEWPRAINAFRKNYLLGSGLGSITLATDNDYLRLLGESGLFGFISFLAIILFFSLQTIATFFKKKRSDTDNYSLILFGALVAQMANAIFIDVFEASKTAYTFWIIMGIYYRLLEFSHSDKR